MVAARADDADDRPPPPMSSLLAARRSPSGVISSGRLRSSPTCACPAARTRSRSNSNTLKGPALTILLPYSRKRFGRGIDYGQLQAAAGARHVWLD